jgi:cytochrome c oxidase assembly protein subunit 15
LGILGFVAWLGKVVVDGNLIPGQITMHMFGAVALIALLVAIILADGRQRAAVPARLWWVGLGLVLCLGVQTYLGTQVREHVDYMNKAGLPRAEWVANFGGIFLAHRSLSWLVTAVAAWWWWQQRQSGTASAPRFAAHGAAVLVLAQVATGVVLAYAGMPALAQPLHLVLSMLLFGCWWYWLLSTRAAANAAAAHGV